MKLLAKEHYDLLDAFERDYSHLRLDREEKALWPKGHVYQDGMTNVLFLAYRKGYSFRAALEASE